ncbi:type VI secretion system protein VasJ [Marinobacter sp. LV10R510-11A]|uniref:type VI secretion system protein TssA n=1 Tax=Marinobacter sp. LV10R510-11A TaxID=1415568 RepID=UPI000BB8DBFE|nr:type VI secretion system protein TssA [Marinobacter sp. LV10R510-11A]SOB77598.1 type VI secretion system protein VasJ [Marinobacter sp. LV10R510-11A]
MQVIEQHPYVEQVVTPLAGESAAGRALGEDAALVFLEDEIMKVGSLAHTDIDWSKVESESLKILSARSKDLKVLGFLLIALQRGGDGERFALSLYLLNCVLETWWAEGWPYPGDKGKRARKMMFTQMLQRAGKGAVGISFDASVGDGRSFCIEVLAKLQAQAQEKELPDDALADLKRGVEKLPQPQEVGANSEKSSEATAASASVVAGAAPSTTSASPSLGALTLDPSNERATRQSLLKVADMLTGTEPERPLGYQIRRYAIWQSITSVPPTRDGKRSDLAAVSADRIAEYREALEKSPDQALWQRIEQSLSVSPFWLDGHWLSASVASALGCESCAESIRAAVAEFVERLPQLTELTFNDGTPFLSPDAQDWLWSASTPGQSGGGASPWEQAYDTARELVGQKGLASAMQLLEEGLGGAREPREQFHWRLTSARLMKDAGLVSLATRQIQDLQQQISGLAIEDWEPALLKQLERLA